MMKLTFGKSEPWSSGWRGWSNSVDVFLDGEKIGTLDARDCNQKRFLEYSFESTHPAAARYPNFVPPIGLKAAKAALRKALGESA